MANPNPSPKTRIRSGKEAETKGRKGGKRSGEVRSRKSSFREAVLKELTEDKQKEIAESVVNKSKHSRDWLELMLELIGEAPSQNGGGLMEDDGFIAAIKGETPAVMDGDDSDMVSHEG